MLYLKAEGVGSKTTNRMSVGSRKMSPSGAVNGNSLEQVTS